MFELYSSDAWYYDGICSVISSFQRGLILLIYFNFQVKQQATLSADLLTIVVFRSGMFEGAGRKCDYLLSKYCTCVNISRTCCVNVIICL